MKNGVLDVLPLGVILCPVFFVLKPKKTYNQALGL